MVAQIIYAHLHAFKHELSAWLLALISGIKYERLYLAPLVNITEFLLSLFCNVSASTLGENGKI